MPPIKKMWSDLSSGNIADQIEVSSAREKLDRHIEERLASQAAFQGLENLKSRPVESGQSQVQQEKFPVETLFSQELASAGYSESAINDIRNEAKELAFILQGVDTEQISMVGLTSGDNVAAGTGTLKDLLLKAYPRTKKHRIKRCYKHFEDCDLLYDLIMVKHDIAMAGLSLLATPIKASLDKNQDPINEFSAELQLLGYKMDLAKVTSDLLKDWFVSGSCILYWQSDVSKTSESGESTQNSTPGDELEPPLGIPGIYNICALNPGDVDWNNSLGQDILTMDIPAALRERVKNAFWEGQKFGKTKQQIVDELVTSGIGEKWIIAINQNRDYVQLLRDDGDNWIIQTIGRKFYGLADPAMKSIFMTLEARTMLTEGDFSAAFMMKHFIQLIQQGESITQGPMSGSTKNWLKPDEAAALLKRIAGVQKAMRIATNHTTKISYIYPPKEMFDGDRFTGIDDRIFNFTGVVRSLMTGDGQNYGGGFLGIKKLIANLGHARSIIRLIWILFFSHKTVAGRIKSPDGYMITTTFNENVLKEPAQLLNEVKELFGDGIMDPRTAASTLGYNPDQMVSSTIRSKKEEEEFGVWGLVSDNIKGAPFNTGENGDTGNGNGKEGRPANPGTTPNEETRTQTPSGRTT